MSRQRSLRKTRVSFSDDEDEDEGGSLARPPASVKTSQQKAKDARRADKKAPLLSFEEGEDAAPAGSAPPNRPRPALRISASSHAPPVSTATYAQRSGEGEYTVDRMKALQQGTRSLPSGAPGIKLSGSFKAASAPKDDRFQHDIDAAGTVDAGKMPLPPPPPRLGTAEPAPPMGPPQVVEPPSDDEVAGGAIPDEETIRRVKEKRERLRSAHMAPDYVPLGGPGMDIRPQKGADKPAAHVVEASAGQDSDGEADLEASMRMHFIGKAKGGGKAEPRPGAGAELDGDVLEDEGAAEWAEEQIRKGMSSGLLRGAAPAPAPTKHGAARELPGVAAAPPSQAAAVAAAADEVMASLQMALQRSQLTQRQAEKNLAKTERSLEECTAALARTEGDIKAAGDKYVFMQQMRAYLADLCAMLAEKSPLIEELQEELEKLREERAAAHAARRQMSLTEEAEPAGAAAAAALEVLSRGGALPEATEAAASAAAAVDERLAGGGHIPEELDEFGRDANAQRRADAARRVAQRAARRSALEQRFARPAQQANGTSAGAVSAWAEPVLGEATSSEDEEEVARYSERAGEIQDAADAVFRDADDEYGTLAGVKSKLEGWKARYPGQYNDVYMSLSAPAVFAPFVRLELLSWAPLDPGTDGFHAQHWYRLLFEYGMQPGAEQPSGGDADGDLVPRLVRSLIVPMAERLVDSVWDPWSCKQSTAAAALLEDLLIYVPPDDEGLQRVISAIKAKLEEAVAAARVPSWPPAALAASPRAEADLARQFGRAVRLLRNVCAFSEALPLAFVQRLALEQLVGRGLMPHVRAAAADPGVVASRALRVVNALPAAWLASGVPRGMEGLVELLGAITRMLERESGDEVKRAARAPAARDLAGVLAKLGDADGARRLALMFGVTL